MLQNYLKIAVRNFTKHTTYSFINLGGLTLAVTCCLLLGLYVWHEWSYDRFHAKTDRLYQAWTQEVYKGDQFTNVATPYSPGPTLKETFPEIEAITRVRIGEYNVRRGSEEFRERVHMVDVDFFRMFDFPLVNNLSANPFRELYSVVLTQERAQKYFGAENPVGKTLNIQLDSVMQAFTVKAVARNVLTNFSIQFGMLIPMVHVNKLVSDRTLKSWLNVTPEFGLATLAVARRTKEIGVRKVLGAQHHEYAGR